jgi:hypothetical protein
MSKTICLLLVIAACISSMAAAGESSQPDVGFFTKLRMEYAQRKDFSPGWQLEED